MELFCPECMGALVADEPGSVRCAIHGGQFRVLFTRWALPRGPDVAPVPPAALAEGAACIQHPQVAAAHACGHCGAPVCATCAFENAGAWLCPNCVTQPGALASPSSGAGFAVAPESVPKEGARCVQHPNVPATQQCKLCGAFICATCDFAMPGGVHVCPACAAAPRTKLSPRRKKLLLGSFALAAWSTVGMTCLIAGVFGRAQDKASEQLLGMVLMVFVLFPSIIGTSLGVAAMDRRLETTAAIWIATIWNGIILGCFILLMIIGLAKG